MFMYSISTGDIEHRVHDHLVARRLRRGARALREAVPQLDPVRRPATILTLLIGFPVAYTIAFRGGRHKSLLLFLVIAPFFTSFLIRTISWKILLGDEGPVLGPLKHTFHFISGDFSLLGTPLAQLTGITYNFLPFMILPLYVALEKIDYRLIEAANDLYANRAAAFLRVTFPLSLPGVFAGSLLDVHPGHRRLRQRRAARQPEDPDDRQRHPEPASSTRTTTRRRAPCRSS